MAVHPYVEPAILKGKATGAKYEVDGNFYTAQTENTIGEMIPELLGALK